MSRLSRSRPLGFALRFALVFLLLALPWPGLAGGMRAAVCLLGGGAGQLLGALGAGRVDFVTPPAETRFGQGGADQWDVLMRLDRGHGQAPFTYAISTRRSAVISTALVCALVVASPWWRPRRKALLALAGSAASVVTLLAFSLLQLLADAALAADAAAGLAVSPGVGQALVKAVNSPTINSLVPLCCWLALAIFASGGQAFTFVSAIARSPLKRGDGVASPGPPSDYPPRRD